MQKTDRTSDADSPREWSAAGRRLSEEAAILLAVFAVGLVAVVLAFRPLGTPAIGFDSAASVLYFDRIAAHQPLEAWVSTTPKPFVTLLYGIVFNLAHDWRALSVLATLEYVAMLAAAAALALRTGGPVAAGMAASGLLGSYLLFEDGSLTYATPWAILFWVAAGLALTARWPRFGLAGIALFLGALARVETFIILGLAAVALGLIQFFAPKGTISHRAFGWTWVAVMMGAFITVFASHDLVTWNPFSTKICCGASDVCGGDRVTCASIHTLALFVFLSLPYAPLLARVSVTNHRRVMVLLFLVMVAGGVSLMMPHRILHDVVFGPSRSQAQTAR